MAKNDKESLFRGLTRLFQSGPLVKRRVKMAQDSRAPYASSALDLFKKSQSHVFNNAMNQYGAYDRMCVSLDTRLLVLDNASGKWSTPTLGELIAKYGDKGGFQVYAYDHAAEKLTLAQARSPRKSGTLPVVRLKFSDQTELVCTPDHRCLKADGTYEEASKLRLYEPLLKSEMVKGDGVHLACSGGIEHCQYALTSDDIVNRHAVPVYLQSREDAGVLDVGDLTVDGHENFATESIVVHNSRYADFSEMLYTAEISSALDIYCLAGDNRVLLLDGSTPTVEDLYKSHAADFRVYSYDPVTQKLRHCVCSGVTKTGTDQPICRVTLEDDCVMRLTSRHLVMTADGTYRRVEELKVGDGIVCADRRPEEPPACTHGWTPEERHLCEDCEEADREAGRHLTTVRERVVAVKSILVDGFDDVYDLHVAGLHNFAAGISQSGGLFAVVHNSDETVAQDDRGRSLHIYSNNPKIRELLGDLFYETLNVEFNLRPWVRSMPVKHDTVIPLLDGRNVTIEQMAREFDAGEENWVYSVQDETKSVVPGKVVWCGKNYTAEKLVRVTFDDGTYVETAPEHPFVLRDGTQRRADELVVDDSLMPFYRRTSSLDGKNRIDGYEMVYDPASRKHRYTHSLVANSVNYGAKSAVEEDVRGTDDECVVVHHVDFDKRNNDPRNLRWMGRNAHVRYHSEHWDVLKQSAGFEEKRRAASLEWLKSDRHRVLAREQLKVLQAKGLMRTSWTEYNESELHQQHNEVRSSAMKSHWADPARREAHMRALRRPHPTMRVEFDDECMRRVYEHVDAAPGYLGLKALCRELRNDAAFVEHFTAINEGKSVKVSIEKTLNPMTLACLIERLGQGDYVSLVASRCPQAFDSPAFKAVMSKRVKRALDVAVHNHRVVAVDVIDASDDVYCMTVVGPDGEHDRHNFAALGRDCVTNEPSLNSGIYTANCQYGDFFAFLDVSPQHGVINVFPIPVNEIEREEGYDPEDPLAVRFRWVTQGNTVLENWQVAHFRLLGNDAFLPYGSSVLESARRIWRQLILIEDAMLVYRIVRSPERRIFYIDVGNIPPDDVPAYIEKARSTLRSNQIVDKTTGRVDLRYNPLCNSLSSLVKLMDGRVLTLGSLIDEWDAGKRDQWVYSVDVEGKRLVPGKVEWAGITKRDAELVRVHIDSGAWFDCTPDHRFMLRDGSYKKAEDLQPDEALMPLYVGYTKKDGTREHNIEGYEKVYDPFTQSYVLTHRNNVIALRGFDAVKGKVIHHVDFEKLNNDPSNLEPMVWKEHMKLHGDAAAERNKTPGARELSRKTMLSTWEQGKIAPAMFVKLWQDPAIRKSRVDRLTLRVDSTFIGHCHRILDVKGRGLSTKETEFRRWLNEDEQVIAYLRELNPTFKNGFTDKLCRGRLQSILKRLGLDNAFTQLKREWLVSRTNVDAVITFCESMGCDVGRKEVMARFSLSRADLQEIVRLAGHDYAEFSARYMQKTLRYRKDAVGYKNHRVTRVERLAHREDTGCITVGQWHNFAAGPSVESLSQETQAFIAAGKPMRVPDDLARSFVHLHNSVDEDYFIPIRGGETGTRIDTLPGGTHVSAIDDVNYIQSKLFAALKVPKAYLGYDDALASKATLAQEDIRFSRTINTIQRVVLSELNKIAAIHLYAHGFDGEDLLDFSLQLSNPSTVAQQQKLELYRAKLEIAGSAPEGLVDRYYLRSRVMGMTDDEIRKVETGLERDRKIDAYFEALTGEEGGGAGGFDMGGASGGDELGGVGEEPGTAGGADDLFASQERSGGRQLLTADDETPVRPKKSGKKKSAEEPAKKSETKPRGIKGFGPDGSPIKASSDSTLGKRLFNKRRQSTHGASKTHTPDFVKMTDMTGPQDVDVFDRRSVGIDTDPLYVGFDEGTERDAQARLDAHFDGAVEEVTRIDGVTRAALRGMGRRFGRAGAIYQSDTGRSVITETAASERTSHDEDQEDWIEIDDGEFEIDVSGDEEDRT